jgi:hypothetical protein
MLPKIVILLPQSVIGYGHGDDCAHKSDGDKHHYFNHDCHRSSADLTRDVMLELTAGQGG